MRWLAGICALLIGASVSGCAIIEAEKNNRGGFLDEIADDLWMKADSKKMRALRAVALEASLARIAMIAPKSASDRALLARRIGETTKRADIVRRCAFFEIQIPGQATTEPCFFFDSVMVDYENALFDLAMIALPIEEAKSLITRVSGGIASATINPLQLVQSLLDIGREAFRYGRVVGAIYRDTLELEVQVWLASPGLADRVGGLAAVYAQGSDNIPAWRAAIAALRAQGLEPVPQPRFIGQLYFVISYICGQIVSKGDDAYRECAQPNLTDRVPLTPIPVGRGLLSGVSVGGGGVIGGGGAAGGNGRANESLQNQLNAKTETINNLKNDVKAAQRVALRGALTPIERDMMSGTLLQIKKTLCVKSPDLEADAFDTQTRERLREFVGGLSWGAVNRNGAPKIEASLSDPLTRAMQSFPTCGDPLKNAYEVGVFARDAADADLTISRAVDKLITAPRPTERRAMILALRKQAEPQNPSTTNDALDDGLWSFIKQHGPFVAPPPPQPVAPNQQKKNP